MDLVFSVHERRCADVDDPGLDENHHIILPFIKFLTAQEMSSY